MGGKERQKDVRREGKREERKDGGGWTGRGKN